MFPGLGVKYKIEMLLLPCSLYWGSREGLLVNEMVKSEVRRLDPLRISNWNIYGRKKV